MYMMYVWKSEMTTQKLPLKNVYHILKNVPSNSAKNLACNKSQQKGVKLWNYAGAIQLQLHTPMEIIPMKDTLRFLIVRAKKTILVQLKINLLMKSIS